MKKLTINLSDARWEKLQALVQSRTDISKGKIKYTPQKCIEGFIDGCVTDGGGWEPPNVTATRHEKEKREKAAAEEAKKKPEQRSSNDGRVW